MFYECFLYSGCFCVDFCETMHNWFRYRCVFVFRYAFVLKSMITKYKKFSVHLIQSRVLCMRRKIAFCTKSKAAVRA